MITLLARFFLKNVEETKQRRGYGTLCCIVGICLNILLFLFKYIAGVLSGSVAITADAFNNLSDAFSSFISLIGFLFSGKKPDLEHPFGHGRFEYIAGLLISLAILLMGFELLKSSIFKILHPETVESSTLIFIILLLSIIVKLYMAFYNKKVGTSIQSAAMKATATDSFSDAIATFFVLVSTIVAHFTSLQTDGISGVIVSLFILYAGISAAKETIDPLLGLAPDTDFVNKIKDIVLSHTVVEGIHDLIVHDYGPGRCMISLHAEVPGNQDIFHLHDEIDCIERELKDKLQCDAVIHMDPIETDNEEINHMKGLVLEMVLQISPNLSIHDFRMVTGPTHTNLIFDILIPYSEKLTEKEVLEKITAFIKELDGNYYPVIQIDYGYSPSQNL